MSSADRCGPAGTRPALPGEALSQAAGPLDPALLEKVLQETIDACENEPLDGPEKERIRAVVERYAGHPLTLEPVAVELVEAVLLGSFPDLSCSPQRTRLLSTQVAGTLMEDPHSQPRLAALWERLAVRKQIS